MNTEQETQVELEQGIPIEFIARLFHNVSFKNEKTRITKKTLDLCGEYIKLFMNEALIRSNEERVIEGDRLTKVDGIDNLTTNRALESTEVEAQVNDTMMNETIVPLDMNSKTNDRDEIDEDLSESEEDHLETQYKNAFNSSAELGNDTLDTKHLSKVAGILVLDF